MMGSCFSTEVGQKMAEDGYKVFLNPFGILFNPASISSSIIRMEECKPFTEDEVIERDGGYVSFSHHGSFRRETPEDFLEHANASLIDSARKFKDADTIILTFGTAWVFRHKDRNFIVSNCHKVPAREFNREFLSVNDITDMLNPVIGRHHDKRWIMTVSPIRHLADGAHGNQLSKSTLLLAIDAIQQKNPDNTFYFPAFEIMIDELRDYSAYQSSNLTHPSEESVYHIYNRFKENFLG